MCNFVGGSGLNPTYDALWDHRPVVFSTLVASHLIQQQQRSVSSSKFQPKSPTTAIVTYPTRAMAVEHKLPSHVLAHQHKYRCITRCLTSRHFYPPASFVLGSDGWNGNAFTIIHRDQQATPDCTNKCSCADRGPRLGLG